MARLHEWLIMVSYVSDIKRRIPYTFASANDDHNGATSLIAYARRLARRRLRKPAKIEIDDFSDEIHIFIRRGNVELLSYSPNTMER